MFGGSTHDGLQLQGSRLIEGSGLGFRDSGLGIGVNERIWSCHAVALSSRCCVTCCYGPTVAGHLHYIHSPHAIPGPQAAKPPKPVPVRVFDLNSARSILVNNTIP